MRWAKTRSELDRLGVQIHRGVEATAGVVLAEDPHAVIVATGAMYSRSGRSGFRDTAIPGSDRAYVYRPEDILVDGARPSGKVVLLDAEGLHTGSGIAEILASAGGQVVYVTPGFAPASARLSASHELRFVVTRLKRAGIALRPSTYLREIGDNCVTVYDVFTEEEELIEELDAVVLVTSRLPADSLARELEGSVAQLFTVGDALAARLLAAAAYEGHKFARYIGESDAPRTVSDAYFMEDPAEQTALPAGNA